MSVSIDNISMIDLSSVSKDELHWNYGTGRFITSGSGKHKNYSYRDGVETPIGDIELSVWCAATEYVIKREGLEEEREQLQEFLSHSQGQSRSGVLSPEVLSIRFCIDGLYRNPEWVCFVPYNRQYHPEVLESAHLVSVVTECCQILGDVTAEQIANSYDGTICCPICGRWSPYQKI